MLLRCLGLLASVTLFGIIAIAPAAGQQGDDLNAVLKRFTELFAAGDYPAALIVAQEFEAGVKARFGVNNPYYASALNNLAVVYWRQNKYGEAEELYKRALAISEKGPWRTSDPDVANTLANLALVYQSQGKYADAEGLYKRALAIREKAFGADHPDVLDTLNNLVLVYDRQHKYAEAEELSRRALAISARTLANQANAYQSQGKYAEAEELYKRALAFLEKALGASHPDVAQTLNNLATCIGFRVALTRRTSLKNELPR
jgi:tetratricopeptide (TPR) repeat protein